MAILNKISGVSTYGKTGRDTYPFDPEKIIGMFLVPVNWSYDATKLASLLTNLQADVLKTPSLRIFPIAAFGEVKDSSEDAKVNTLGYGIKRFLADGNYDWTFKVIDGGVGLQNNLRKMNKRNMKAVFWDSNNVLIGTQRETAGTLGGVALSMFHAKPWKINDGSNPVAYEVQVSTKNPKDLNEDIAFAQAEFDIEQNVLGLLEVTLEAGAAAAGGKITVRATTGFKQIDLYDVYADALAVVGAWSLVKKTDGSAITITGVTKNVAVKGWDLAFTYTGDVDASLATPAALAALHVGEAPGNGYESDILTQTVPAP